MRSLSVSAKADFPPADSSCLSAQLVPLLPFVGKPEIIRLTVDNLVLRRSASSIDVGDVFLMSATSWMEDPGHAPVSNLWTFVEFSTPIEPASHMMRGRLQRSPLDSMRLRGSMFRSDYGIASAIGLYEHTRQLNSYDLVCDWRGLRCVPN
jgi:hypothetical protein